MLSESFYEASITLIPKSDKDTNKKQNKYKPVSLMNTYSKFLNTSTPNSEKAIATRKIIEHISKTKFFEKINKIQKQLKDVHTKKRELKLIKL